MEMFFRRRAPIIIQRFATLRNFSNKIYSNDPVVARYVKRQMTDEFSKLAKAHSYRARSAFKLLEINKKFNIFKKNNVVVDIGAAPGSWCQIVSEILFPTDVPQSSENHGYILGVDLQPMSPIDHVDLITQADITKLATQDEIKRRLGGRIINVVLSDMAPNPTGDPSTDHERIVTLCRTVYRLISDDEFSVLPMIKGGKFLCKIWDGVLRAEFIQELQVDFKYVRILKPSASRDHSAETYLYASGYKTVESGVS